MDNRYFVGLDLGQANDYTAAAVCEEIPASFAAGEGSKEKGLHVRHLERYRHKPYPEIVERVEHLLDSPALKHRTELVIDITGVGTPVADLFKKRNRRFRGVLITGGDTEHRGEDGNYRVPKRNLVSGLQVLLQSGRLKIAGGLELAEVLKAELLNFKVKINLATAHDSYEAWRENDHDDLVLGVALAGWGASKIPPLQAPIMVRVDRPGSFGGGALTPSWSQTHPTSAP
jgi:hypothetical protein